MLKLYNTLTRTKEEFRPLDAANVRMYVCGPTVYDFAHIGNARPVIVFDVLYRLLRHLAKQGVWDGGKGQTKVTYVRNITDVDDKINARAAEEYPALPLNEAIREVTRKTEAQFHEDVAALGCLEPTHEPRATEYVRRDDGVLDMVTLIQRLIDNDNAYPKNGHVLFRVDSMPDYGKLAGRSLDEMLAGARVEIAPYKENPMDFVLWKPSTENEPGWESPWGRGRPGWHIECSAMSAALLGEEFDIHGGGIDLVFPHHENELAQSRCAFHSGRMAQVWMHNGFLQVEGAKMSKSLGNFVTIRELRESWGGHPWPGEALRFNMLRTHYRQPIDWTLSALDESHKVLWTWYADLKEMSPHHDLPGEVLNALCDDLNTPQAISALHKLHSEGDLPRLGAALNFLGFSGDRQNLIRHYVMKAESGHYQISGGETQMSKKIVGVGVVAGQGVSSERVNKMVAARNAARKAKDFKESDRIRDELAAMGVILKDNKDGTTSWEVAR